MEEGEEEGIPLRQEGRRGRETQKEFGVAVQDTDHARLCGAAAVPVGPVHRK